MKNIVIIAHKFLTQPDDDLAIFLNEKKYNNVLHIRHSFSDARDRTSYYTWYKDGKFYREEKTRDYKNFSEPIIYLKEFYYTFKWIWQTKIKWDCCIGMDGLCVSFGNILRFFGKVRKTVFWAIDFVPEKRFDSGIKNKIYHWVNINGYKNSDEMWDLSPRMAEARKKFLEIGSSDYKSRKIVPNGVWTERIKKYSFEECEKNTLVFMGHLLEKQGVQLVIKVIPEIVKCIPNFKFKIIGSGKYKDALVKLSKDLNVSEFCDFRGKIDDIKVVEQEIAKSCVAIAPYIKKLDTWTYYGDSGKVKTYLACGVPVLLTDIPWDAQEIKDNKCGEIITEEKRDIIDNIIKLFNPNINQEYRNNAIKYAESFDYEKIFNQLPL